METIKKLNVSTKHMQSRNIDKYFFNAEGVKEADKCNYKEAIEYFTRAIELDPKDSLSYFNRATVEMAIGKTSEAMSDFRLSESFRLLEMSQII
jgi:tetratricopeptide (TPR) repeat protein